MLMPLHVDFVIQAHFVAEHAAESPIAGRTFNNANFDVLMSDTDPLLDRVKQQTDEFLLGSRLPSRDHADFDNRVSITSTAGCEKILLFHWKEAMGSFIRRKLQRFHHTLMNHISQLLLDGVEMVFNPVNFDLCHVISPTNLRFRLQPIKKPTSKDAVVPA